MWLRFYETLGTSMNCKTDIINIYFQYHLCSPMTRALLLSTYVKFINLFPEIKQNIQVKERVLSPKEQHPPPTFFLIYWKLGLGDGGSMRGPL